MTKFIYFLFSRADQRGIEISTIWCRFSLNSYSLARYCFNCSIKIPDDRTITLFSIVAEQALDEISSGLRRQNALFQRPNTCFK